MTRRISYQGEPGSYSEEALWRQMAGLDFQSIPTATFKEAAQAVMEGTADSMLLPVENTLTGPIEAAVQAAGEAGLEEHRSFWMTIEHCIIGHPDAKLADLETVHSHPAALEQCQSILETLGLEGVPAEDTAGAVREVKERGDLSEAAIASTRAAAKHGMKVLAKAVQDPGDNRTRFAFYGKRLR